MKHLLMKILGLISPMLVTRLLYFKAFHKFLNLKNPINLNEKIQWLKFYGDTSKWAVESDKYRVREFIRENGLSDILVNLYGQWENTEDLDWNKLPNSFVLKANHGCGDVVICKDKNLLDKEATLKYYKELLATSFGIETGQKHYQLIKPCLVAEELLDAKQQSVESSSLVDYKFWCINGIPEYVFVCINRTKTNVEVSLYDTDWKNCSERLVYSDEFRKCGIDIPKPKCFNRMLEVSSILAKNHPQVRVDLYEVNAKVYFGELTFTSACGLMTYFSDDLLEELGRKIKLHHK